MFLKKLAIPTICATLMSSTLFTTTIALAADDNIKEVTEIAMAATFDMNVELKAAPVFVEKNKTLQSVTADTLLNLRKEPKEDGEVIDLLDTGVIVFVQEEQGEWSKVKVGEKVGYVATEYLKEITNETLYVGEASVNLREKPTTESKAIKTLEENQALEVVSEENGWAKVKVDGKEGYISAEFLTADKPVVEQEVVQPASTTQSNSSATSATSNNTQSNSATGSTSSSSSNTTNRVPSTSTTTQTQKPAQSNGSVISIAKSLLGRPYVFGASGPNAFDCSGFISYVYKAAGKSVGRTSVAGYWGMVSKTSNPVAGDVIFFQNTYKSGPSHAGIYLGGGQFIHAGDGGVQISSTSNSYWKQHFLGYGRF